MKATRGQENARKGEVHCIQYNALLEFHGLKKMFSGDFERNDMCLCNCNHLKIILQLCDFISISYNYLFNNYNYYNYY